MNHLGQRLSALIDGELEEAERERAVLHMVKCRSCRDEVAALWALKRRMNALNESMAGAGLAGLMGRLMGLSDAPDLDGSTFPGGMTSGENIWPPPPPPGGWPVRARGQQEGPPADRNGHQDQRGGRLFLAGSVAIFLAGLGTAAVIAGGEPQARAPAPPVTPSIDVLVAPHNFVNQGQSGGGPGSDVLMPRSRAQWSHPDIDVTSLPAQP